ncbi:hypothetical protein PVMG_05498 [Plasmodium vivax Mauritania I]|uniref:Variable surface protein Vir18 n=1 Tax=Plasmodium vivax Mauritania I TaxID=1035515 RepID=A0A0J9TBF2_PLAVI|nr:hypothetical protein PVMG_05498 [Plasmodium vivax Mauritania I]
MDEHMNNSGKNLRTIKVLLGNQVELTVIFACINATSQGHDNKILNSTLQRCLLVCINYYPNLIVKRNIKKSTIITVNAHIMGGITINVYDRNQALNSQDCIRTYVDILDDIQGRIAEFEENEHVNFHKDWEQLIKYINEQKNELKICYDRKLLEIHLNSNEDIIRFYRKCNSNPKCRNYILPQDKELIELKDDIPKQRLGTPSRPTHSALGSNPNDSSAQSGSERESPPTGIPQEKTSETAAPQRDARNSQTLNGNAHGSQGVDSQTDKIHPLVDEDASMETTTENHAEGTSVSGNHGATISEGDVTKAVGSVPVDSERSASSVPAVASDHSKVVNLKNHGSHDNGGRSPEKETLHRAESSESTCSEKTACKQLDGQLNPDSSITNAGNRTQSSLSTSYTNAADEGSMNQVTGLTIRSNQDYTDAHSTKLQGGDFSQSKSLTVQESINKAGALLTEVNHKQGPQNQGNNLALSQGSGHGNKETFEGGAPNRENNYGETLASSRNHPSGAAGGTGDAVATWSDNVLDMLTKLFSEGQYKEYIMMALVPLAIILLLTFLIKVN